MELNESHFIFDFLQGQDGQKKKEGVEETERTVGSATAADGEPEPLTADASRNI